MSGLSVIIPSRVVSNLQPCVAAVKKHEPGCRVIVIDDGLANRDEDALYIDGAKPFIFARNMNIGIRAAGEDDVILLNDDAILETPGGFSLLQKAAAENPEYGVIASTTNNVGNTNQFRKGIGLRREKRMVCFVAVLIPRRAIEKVGLLDERYVAYGADDDDWCLRARLAGFQIGIHDGCFVDHKSLPSTFRDLTKTASQRYGNGIEIFKQKWGRHPL